MPDHPQRPSRRTGHDHHPDPRPRPAPHAAGAALIADCDYCGSRSVVRFEPGARLACPGCGARLGPLQQTGAAAPAGVNGARARHKPERPAPRPSGKSRKRAKKKKKFGFREVLEEAWDVLDDLFD